MNIYELFWSKRGGYRREWFRTERDMVKRRTELKRLGTKRPYDQIEIVSSGKRLMPTDKGGLVDWLNHNFNF